MNDFKCTGRLVKDVEIKTSNSGKSYCKFSLAVKRYGKGDLTDFINFIAYDKQADLLNKFTKKGNRILVTGALHSNKYESNGEKRTSYEVNCINIELLEFNEKNNSNFGSGIDEISPDDGEFPF